MTKLIIANWKQLPETIEQAMTLLDHTKTCLGAIGVSQIRYVVCPRPEYRTAAAAAIGNNDSLALGAQDMSEDLSGSGAQYVIIGHSDRRWKAGDSDEVTNTKLRDALAAGLQPIVCFGERSRSDGWRDELVAQTVATLKGLTEGQVLQCLIAYEPVWAISTQPDAKPDTPASAVTSMNVIRETIADHCNVSHSTYLYGGSITPANVASFLERSEVGGVLVGGASVRPDDVSQVISIAATIL
ncbi:MAG: triosephosphate isomerase [Candidatus Pacebacteria bacterium]|nr:triosephosphate isomerase [Candidatus Paceibacterota bacterium]